MKKIFDNLWRRLTTIEKNVYFFENKMDTNNCQNLVLELRICLELLKEEYIYRCIDWLVIKKVNAFV